jgi:iron complex outermembrane recepter protein
LASVSLVVLGSLHAVTAFAQSASSSDRGALPPLVVQSPKPRAAAPAAAAPSRRSDTSRAVRRTQNPPANSSAPSNQANSNSGRQIQDPRGPINGYVAERSLTGTKTNTPLMETPQAISVVGAEQIRDQKPQNVAQALRYVPGVDAATFGSDTRNDWFKIRGFDAQDVGMFLDGLQLQTFAFATWKIKPFGIERIDILRGPSAMLYGGSAPGGMVNIISKTPPTQPTNYIETGVDSWANAYLSFDFGGPAPSPTGPGSELYYRMLGTVKNGGTQTDFTNDDSYFIAPSFRYKPDLDTSFTVLALASKDKTRVQNFLPYIGTVVNAPFGRIPTSLFASDPSVDTFTVSRKCSAISSRRI